MKTFLLTLSVISIAAVNAFAQNKPTDPPLSISGSVDTYYKYDFSGHNNIPTSFATDQNSVSIGMVDVGLKKKVNKALFAGELSFGPRGEGQSIPNAGTNGQSFHIQNLYMGYDLTDKLNVTAGYMATFVGYEVIAPTGNFNYSTSYLFTNGPFQNAGIKFNYAFSDKISLMAGVFNDDWNVYTSVKRVNSFGTQLMIAPVKGWTAYLNLITGPLRGTEFDLTTAYQITDILKLGLNAADFSAANSLTGGFSGAALYPQLMVSKTVTLGLRGEYFKNKTGTYGATNVAGPTPGQSVTAFTLTANIKGGPLTFIPEIRLDNGSKEVFTNSNNALTRSASHFLLAAVYTF